MANKSVFRVNAKKEKMMRVSFVSLNLPKRPDFAFKQSESGSHDDEIYGYDDEISRNRRDYIRKDIEYNSVPYYRYHKETRLSDYELQKKIKEFSGENKIVDCGLSNLRLVNGRKVTENLYASGLQEGFSEEDSVEVLKDSKITAVIDFYGNKNLADGCKKQGLKYVRCFGNDVFREDIFKSEHYYIYSNAYGRESDEEYLKRASGNFRRCNSNFVKEMANVFELMNNENCLMGCEFGTYQTNKVLMLSYIFNPEDKQDARPSVMSGYMYGYPGKKVQQLYDNLTEEDKKVLHINNENAQARVKERLAELKKCDDDYDKWLMERY